jgi:hypothetical protein
VGDAMCSESCTWCAGGPGSYRDTRSQVFGPVRRAEKFCGNRILPYAIQADAAALAVAFQERPAGHVCSKTRSYLKFRCWYRTPSNLHW